MSRSETSRVRGGFRPACDEIRMRAGYGATRGACQIWVFLDNHRRRTVCPQSRMFRRRMEDGLCGKEVGGY